MTYRARKYRPPMKYFVADGGPWNRKIVGLSAIPGGSTAEFRTCEHQGYYNQIFDKTTTGYLKAFKHHWRVGIEMYQHGKKCFILNWVDTKSIAC